MLGFILKALISIFLVSISITDLYFELLNVFEYQDGLSDLSTIEITFFVSSFVLLKRYWGYTKKTSLRWWHIISTPFLWHGKFLTAALLCASVIGFIDLFEGTEHFKNMLLLEQDYEQIFSFGIILLCFYIAVPSQALILSPDSVPPLGPKNNDDHNTTSTNGC